MFKKKPSKKPHQNAEASTSQTDRKNLSKKTNQVKFTGTLILIFSVLGVLIAVGGQLDFLGNKRPDVTKKAPTTDSHKNKPKYSFYDELKKRKTELDQQQPNVSTQKPDDTLKTNEKARYVVQVGAFSKKTDAQKVQQKVEGLGYKARIVKGGQKYLTQVGPLIGKNRAVSVEKRLRSQKIDTLIKLLK